MLFVIHTNLIAKKEEEEDKIKRFFLLALLLWVFKSNESATQQIGNNCC